MRREAETLASLPEYNVTVLTLKEGGAAPSYDVDGVRLIELNEKKYDGKNKVRYVLSYIKFLVLSLFTCTKLFLSGKVDIVHVHNMPNFLVFAGIVPWLFGKKLILDIHDSVPETYLAKFNTSSALLFRILCLEESISCSFAHKIISVNHVQHDVLVKRGIPSEKIIISMNVPDPKRFDRDNIRNARGKEDHSFKMIYHGTIAKRLGVDLAIEAVALLKNKILNLEFHVWGKSGDDFYDFIRLSEELAVSDKVCFINGGVPLDRLPLELTRMDLGVIGNKKGIATELMLPVKMLEYIALGIPVVAPRLKCIEYYFSDEMVCYFDPEDVDSMASAIFKLYKDESLRKKQAEKAKAFLNQYGWEKHKMDLINLYKNI